MKSTKNESSSKGSKKIEVDTTQIKRAAGVIRSINHKLRQSMINLLERNENMQVTEIYVKLRLEQSVASQHLGILRKSGVVIGKREGKFIYYSLDKNRLSEVYGLVGQLAK